MSSYPPASYLPQPSQQQPTPPSFLPYAQTPPSYSSSTPPAPPPKSISAEARGPPPPPLPPGQNEVSELDASQGHPHHYAHQTSYQQSPPPLPQHYQQQQQGQYQQQQESQANIPPIEAGWLPEGLREKSTTDLSALLSQQGLQTALLLNLDTTHPSVPASVQPLKTLLQTNNTLAQNLTSLESHLNHLRSDTQTRLLALKALESQHRTHIDEAEQALRVFSPMALYQRLVGSVGEQEGVVRSVEESWMEGEGVASSAEVETFVRRVREVSKVAFLRRERKGRWDEGRVGGWR